MPVASIQTIKEIRAHPNADSLELAFLLGWQVCVKKGEFKTGDRVIYIEIDSIVEERPYFEFLRNKNFRIKTVKLRGQMSQGICFPLDILPAGEYIDGQDVSEIVGAKHFEKPIPEKLAGEMRGYRPSFFHMTDEPNAQSYPAALDELIGKPYILTLKSDGTSLSCYIKDGLFGVCSRNVDLKENETNIFWRMAKKFDIENKLKSLNINCCCQAEIVGGSINGNKMNYKEVGILVFDLFDIDKQEYFDSDYLKEFCANFSLPMVEILEEGDSFNYSLNQLQEMSNGLKHNDVISEGMVLRSKYPFYSETLGRRHSIKIVNQNYLIKHNE